jgi:prepilin-type N-terminal cleavage/methylation domain-containing protein
MEPLMTKRQCNRGFTLVEVALVIAVIAILAAFALVSFSNTGETRDASMVQSSQAALQSLISQGAARMDVKPSELDANMVLTAIRANVGEKQDGSSSRGVTFTATSGATPQYTMIIASSQRSAVFEVSTTGDVKLKTLNNFQHYQVDQNGIIQKR